MSFDSDLKLVTILWIVMFEVVLGWEQIGESTFLTSQEWREIWEFEYGHRGRMGHSLVSISNDEVVLFGGKDNPIHRPHVPKTYEISDETLEFLTYDQNPLSSDYDSSTCSPQMSCIPSNNSNDDICQYSWSHFLSDEMTDEQILRKEEECGFVTSGLYYNDVWIFSLSNKSWKVLHPGAKYGGCRSTQNNERVCEVPSGRYGHGATLLYNSQKMIIYGGYSQECQDYCQDLWSFDIKNNQWRKLILPKSNNDDAPEKRWKFSFHSTRDENTLLLFGGHRMGKYLNDLWTLSLNHSYINASKWEKSVQLQSCEERPGDAWEERFDVECQIHWPLPRAGHASVYDSHRHGLWIHGGYSVPNDYPGNYHFDYYLDDLWFYNLTSGYWTHHRQGSKETPKARMDHVLMMGRDGRHNHLLILFGGYSDHDEYHNDTWYYYVDRGQWYRKSNFVHATFNETSCQDDFAHINDKKEGCVKLQYPRKLQRSKLIDSMAIPYQAILPFAQQSYYTPDKQRPFYLGIFDKNEITNKILNTNSSIEQSYTELLPPDGTPIAPYAATGPHQYAKQKFISFDDTELEVWEWCVTGKAEPSRHATSSEKDRIIIPQAKRRGLGWDGCRDNLHWMYPPSRSGHAGVAMVNSPTMIIHGGATGSKNTSIIEDIWSYSLEKCPSDCHNHGDCIDGFCHCYRGFYGLDCSNLTCPGSICTYHELTHEQYCSHCCYDFDSMDSIDNSQYNSGIRKVPCRPLIVNDGIGFTGQRKGICNGFGSCQCQPPYIGEDCSIKDCQHNCSFQGYCSVEFPVSRCMCKTGYYGEYCQHMECLNNCSYPNGICNPSTGQCACSNIQNPFNTSNVWSQWQGEDCSYLPSWCSNSYSIAINQLLFITILYSIAITFSD